MSWLLNNGGDKQDPLCRIVGKGHIQNDNSSTPKTQCYRARKATPGSRVSHGSLSEGLFQITGASPTPPPAESPVTPRLFPAPGKLAALLSSILFLLVNAAGAAAKIEQILSMNGSDGNFQ